MLHVEVDRLSGVHDGYGRGQGDVAEQAARVAIDAGGAQHKFFDEALNARARDRVVLETELRYSSLSHLMRLPMSELKIDRAFITDVARGGRDSALAAAVITLGSELGLQVVAEGVETQEQSEFLIGRGCALQQGYLFSKPVPQAAFEQMLKTGTARATHVATTA